MITTDLRNAAGLAAAAECLDRSAPAPAAPRAHRATALPIPIGIAPGRPPAIALAARPARARKARSGLRAHAGYAPAKAAAPKASSTAKSSAASKSTSASKSSSSDPLAFLRDKKLTIEEKLMKLLGYMNERWEKEMQAKMDEIAASEQEKKKQASKSSGSGGGGLLGGVLDVVQKAFTGDVAGAVSSVAKLTPAPELLGKLVSDLGGPALAAGAAALGFPELSPALLKLGPELGKLAKGWLADAEGGGGSGSTKKAPSSSSGKSSSSSGGGKVLSDSEQQVLVMEIQRIQQQQKEMFALVSNVLKGNHDARMSVLNNIR
ncbi:MAG TPA: hypothetical protein VFK90_03965 [Anaeromyxobacter sp.]|nr:hypothetical protein [Anaeromyxobacter sp.]